ncbi:hypothetical protein UFOVP180_47 [uncultured Caudovirales phage]|uniref:Uncharacterized protein n=1 Tax=uncultured Caudovirales phage TaxID=2100421 RepID=A0A6J7WK82_9CAUD|nr:hypothetical protein UFOVP180_47 [uncultured Caudovirales phage]
MLLEELDKLDKQYASMNNLWNVLAELKLKHRELGDDTTSLNMWMRDLTLAKQQNRNLVVEAKIRNRILLSTQQAVEKQRIFESLFDE